MSLELVLDTETTGFEPDEGHRLIEVAAVEVSDGVPTGAEWRWWINPNRTIPEEATRVHGITLEMLKDKPFFEEVAAEIHAVLAGRRLVIHNKAFDTKFLNHEFRAVGLPELDIELITDTMDLARRRFPGAQVNLDALCRRFNIAGHEERTVHGALIDARLTALVYLELLGGRQRSLDLLAGAAAEAARAAGQRLQRTPVVRRPTEEELAAHATLIGKIKDPVWARYAA